MPAGKNVYPLVRFRHTAREFLPKQVSDEDLNAILEAGRWAPSSLNLQPWNFIVIKNKKLISLILNSSFYNSIYERNARAAPPVMVAIVLNSKSVPETGLNAQFAKKFSPQINYLNVAMPALNMVYQAEALGLSAGIKTPAALEVRELLKLPVDHECALFVALGYETEGAQVHDRARKPLADLVFYEKFGRKKTSFF